MSRPTGRTLGLLASLGLLGWVLHDALQGWREIGSQRVSVRAEPLAAAALALVVAYLLRAGVYAALLRRLDPGAPVIPAMKTFFASQAGRYVPGKVWQIVGAAMLAKLNGVSARAAGMASLIVVALHHLAGAVLGVLGFRQISPSAVWVIPLAAGGVLLALGFLASGLFPRIVARAARAGGPDLGTVAVPGASLLLALLPFFVAVWALFGVSLWMLCLSLLPDLGVEGRLGVVTAIGVMAGACVAGYAAVFSPSGLGVREATLVILLAPSLGGPAAGLVAIGMRVLMTLLELVLISWGLIGTVALPGSSDGVPTPD